MLRGSKKRKSSVKKIKKEIFLYLITPNMPKSFRKNQTKLRYIHNIYKKASKHIYDSLNSKYNLQDIKINIGYDGDEYGTSVIIFMTLLINHFLQQGFNYKNIIIIQSQGIYSDKSYEWTSPRSISQLLQKPVIKNYKTDIILHKNIKNVFNSKNNLNLLYVDGHEKQTTDKDDLIMTKKQKIDLVKKNKLSGKFIGLSSRISDKFNINNVIKAKYGGLYVGKYGGFDEKGRPLGSTYGWMELFKKKKYKTMDKYLGVVINDKLAGERKQKETTTGKTLAKIHLMTIPKKNILKFS
jgi:hypothetical protein